ncbi:unnamed protein product [Rhizophagus irregularis]|nr:unnamed protein product [Rhizophagus irregularis]
MIKHHTVKRKTNNISNFLNFFIWNIVFFSFIPFASTKDSPIVNEKYDSSRDLYDSILNKNDGHNDLFNLKHVFTCNLRTSGNTFLEKITPAFWIFTTHNRKNTIGIPLTITFIILFGICLATFILVVIISLLSHYFQRVNEKMNVDKIVFTLCIICFYVPNILQTLLILAIWPVNYYFVKACVFILLIALTRNVSYFIDKIPENFLATSTSVTQCSIRAFTKNDIHEIFKESQISAEEMRQKQETMQSKIDEMQSKMNEMKSSMDKIKNDQPKDESV